MCPLGIRSGNSLFNVSKKDQKPYINFKAAILETGNDKVETDIIK